MKAMFTELRYNKYLTSNMEFCNVSEGILNSRPFTHISINADDFEALMPYQFLIGPNFVASSLGDFDEQHLNLLSKWRPTQKLDLFQRR